MGEAARIQVLEDVDRAAALLHPMRLRILEGLRDVSDSASGVARRLALPRQKVNSHLRELEKAGLVELTEERHKGNCTERVVRATAQAYLIGPQALGALAEDPAQTQDRFSSAYLVSVAARAIRHLAVLIRRAARAGKKLPTLSLETQIRFASADARRAFTEELAATVAQLATKYHDEHAPGGRPYRLFLGAYPEITRDDDDEDRAHD